MLACSSSNNGSIISPIPSGRWQGSPTQPLIAVDPITHPHLPITPLCGLDYWANPKLQPIGTAWFAVAFSKILLSQYSSGRVLCSRQTGHPVRHWASINKPRGMLPHSYIRGVGLHRLTETTVSSRGPWTMGPPSIHYSLTSLHARRG